MAPSCISSLRDRTCALPTTCRYHVTASALESAARLQHSKTTGESAWLYGTCQ